MILFKLFTLVYYASIAVGAFAVLKAMYTIYRMIKNKRRKK